jgi:hypothetical protein
LIKDFVLVFKNHHKKAINGLALLSKSWVNSGQLPAKLADFLHFQQSDKTIEKPLQPIPTPLPPSHIQLNHIAGSNACLTLVSCLFSDPDFSRLQSLTSTFKIGTYAYS